ncbi:MAG: ATP-dependent zinc metalloprotease FtsH [Acholeplasmatales bacterium]|nr:ATP-dependent zinc metalloprotease FtsH [Acholeplasmatales bacterium]
MDNNQQNNQNQNNQQNNQNKNNTPNRRKGGFFSSFGAYILVILLIIGVWFAYSKLKATSYETIEYSELTSAITEDRYISGSAKPAGESNEGIYIIKGTIYEDAEHTEVIYYKINVTESQYDELVGATYNVDITLKTISTNAAMTWIMYLLPYVLIIGAIILISRSSGNSKAFDFAKSNARKSNGGKVTFDDVAGCDEEKQELIEVVDFLKSPKKYADMGARIPKGILLFGPPGTGKTLLARAVAGEAGVPFFSISGSEFVEMFVGVGASRVRDLFKQAKEQHPCIIFIDEIDAVGRQRGAGMGGGHDEREQTLNQLLVEMDGFSTNLGIIVMAATNRPDVLDPALLRPGRFDRQITISAPDVTGREAILKVHARNKHLAEDVKLDELAARIPGFSGADIENLLNEAAILAARDNRKVISADDLDEATDRVMMGPAKKSRKYSEHEKDLVAHHEAGHAVIGLKLEHANVVQKVTIIPRGQAGGYTLMLPEQETYFETKRSLLDQITGLLGGRVAEEITFNEVSTGASNDFQRATRIARSMVTEYGMSSLGPVQYEQQTGSVFLGRDYMKEKNFSDQVALEIDREQRKIIEECYTDCKRILTENIDLLNTIAEYLKKVETLTKADIDEIAETMHLKRWDDRDRIKAEREAKEAMMKAAENATKACPTCGTENKKDAMFCINCGRNIESVTPHNVEPVTPSTPSEEKPLEEKPMDDTPSEDNTLDNSTEDNSSEDNNNETR